MPRPLDALTLDALRRFDVRMPAIAIAIWCGTWAATGERWAPVAVALSLALLTALIAVWRRWAMVGVMAVVVLASLAVGGARTATLMHHPVRALAHQDARATVEFTLRTDPRHYAASATRPGLTTATAALHRVETRDGGFGRVTGTVVVRVSGDDAAELLETPVGSRVRARATLRAPDPGEPHLAVITLRSMDVVAPPGWPGRAVEHVRGGLRDAVADLPTERRALVPSLVVGDLRHMTEELREDFIVTGLTHLTAVSGANNN